MATNRKYWATRRLLDSEKIGQSAIVKIIPIFEQALSNIDKEVKSIYDNYSKKGILDVSELRKAIGPAGKAEFLRKISKSAAKLGLDPSKVYDERYLSRLTRLEALTEQIKLESMSIAPQSENLSAQAYKEILKSNYSSFQSDIKDSGAITPSFETLDKRMVDSIMRSTWQGGNYSSRIWGNTQKLASRLPTIIGGALASGQSYQKTARQIKREFDVGTYEATRIVRTESNYFFGQSELQGYIDDGITRYQFRAVLDSRTSRICRHLNGQVFFVKDAMPGVNFHPMHGNCRSGSTEVFDGEKVEAPKSYKQRLQRFSDFDNGDIKERWKKAMQKQMDPNKAAHDYNAEMNTITRGYKGEELQSKLDDLMKRMPKDYPLRGGLEKIAEINGWKKPALTEATSKVDELLDSVGIDRSAVKFNEDQKIFIDKSGLKFDPVRSGTDDIGGAYNPQTNTISIDAANLRSFSKELNKPDYINRVLQHELGHTVDNFAPQLRNDTATFSESKEFAEIIKGRGGESAEAMAISQYRMADTIQNQKLSNNIRTMTPEVYGQMVQSREGISVDNIEFKVPREDYSYHTQPDELFAESYSLYNTDPDYLKRRAPKIFDYISSITKRRL